MSFSSKPNVFESGQMVLAEGESVLKWVLKTLFSCVFFLRCAYQVLLRPFFGSRRVSAVGVMLDVILAFSGPPLGFSRSSPTCVMFVLCSLRQKTSVLGPAASCIGLFASPSGFGRFVLFLRCTCSCIHLSLVHMTHVAPRLRKVVPPSSSTRFFVCTPTHGVGRDASR